MLYCMLVACVFLSERESAIIMFVNYRRRHTLERIDYKLSVLLITRFERVAPAKPGLTRAISCTCLPVSLNLVAALLRVVGITAGLAESNMAACRRVYDSRHLQADCQEPWSGPEPYTRQSSTGYLYRYMVSKCRSVICSVSLLFSKRRVKNGLDSISMYHFVRWCGNVLHSLISPQKW